MLQNFKIALSTKLNNALGMDLNTAYETRVIDFFDNAIGPLYTTLSGYLWKIDPEHVIQNLCYNVFLTLVSATFITLFVCTLIFKELEVTSLSIISNFALASFMISTFNIHLFVHRFEVIRILNILVNWVELKRRPKNQFQLETFSLKYIRVYWAPLVWTTWACFMVSTPVIDYLSNGRTYSLPFPLWFPFRTENLLGYAVGYAFEICAVHYFCSFAISSVPMFFVVCNTILSEYNYLIDSIRSLQADALATYEEQQGECTNIPTDPVTDEEYFELYKDRAFQYCCERCLRQINIKHLEISRVIRDTNRRISFPVTLFFTFAHLIIGFAFCTVVIGIGDLSLKVTFTAIGMMDLVLIWSICYLSQMLIVKGENVREELYFTNWYHWPEGMKRSLRIMLVRSLYPPHFSGVFPDIRADYITFAAMVNSTYSFINLVNAFTQ